MGVVIRGGCIMEVLLIGLLMGRGRWGGIGVGKKVL
jgi:hypothetical protein